MSISFELDLDQQVIVRKTYGILDLMSDLGGMIGILLSGFTIVVSIINYHNFDNYMASLLYKVRRDTETGKDTDLAKEATKTGAEGEDRRKFSEEEIKPSRLFNFYEWLFDLVPSFLHCNHKCCKKTREMREMQEARE